MSTASLENRINDLLGDEPAEVEGEHECPIFLEMSPATARVLVEGLRWALYGGTPPPDGRRSLLILLDGITTGLAQ